MIRKLRSGGYRLYSRKKNPKTGRRRNLGTFKTRAEAEALFQSFHALLTGKTATDDGGANLGKLEVFSGVREFPVRVKCATLAWHTFHAALEGENKTVSTE